MPPVAATTSRRRALGRVATLLLGGLAACMGTGPRTVPVRSASLHDRLGGTPKIEAVVERFVAGLQADGRVSGYFAGTDTAALKAKLTSQICLIAGGPCLYTGRDMRTVHTGLRITDAEFDAFMEDMAAALDSQGVAGRERDELLGLLEPLKVNIVGG